MLDLAVLFALCIFWWRASCSAPWVTGLGDLRAKVVQMVVPLEGFQTVTVRFQIKACRVFVPDYSYNVCNE